MTSGKTIEKDLENKYKDRIERLRNLVKAAEENQKTMKQIICEIAEDLEKGENVPLNQISTLTTRILKDVAVSRRYITECLEDKYKNTTRSENARQQKKIKSSNMETESDLAELVPRNPKEEDGSEAGNIPDASDRVSYEEKQRKDTLPPKDISVLDVDNIAILSPKELTTEQTESRNSINVNPDEMVTEIEPESVECLECPKKDHKIHDLEDKIRQQDEIIEKSPKAQTACDKTEESKPFDITFDITYEDLRKDMAGINRLVKASNIIRFEALFDPITKRLSRISWKITP